MLQNLEQIKTVQIPCEKSYAFDGKGRVKWPAEAVYSINNHTTKLIPIKRGGYPLVESKQKTMESK